MRELWRGHDLGARRVIHPVPKPRRKRVAIKPRWEQTGFAVPKHQRIRDPEHLAAVRRLACCTCVALQEKQRTKTQAHHVVPRRSNHCGGDDSAAPLCVKHHKLADLLGWKSYKQRTKVDLVQVAKDLWAMRQKYGSCAP